MIPMFCKPTQQTVLRDMSEDQTRHLILTGKVSVQIKDL